MYARKTQIKLVASLELKIKNDVRIEIHDVKQNIYYYTGN